MANCNVARGSSVNMNCFARAVDVQPLRGTFEFFEENTRNVCRSVCAGEGCFIMSFNSERNAICIGEFLNFRWMDSGPRSIPPQMSRTRRDCHLLITHPMDPSISNSKSLLSSTAYSIGNSRVKGSKNPFTMRPIASSSVKPRLMR